MTDINIFESHIDRIIELQPGTILRFALAGTTAEITLVVPFGDDPWIDIVSPADFLSRHYEFASRLITEPQ